MATSSAVVEYQERYLTGKYLFHDAHSGLTVNFAGFSTFYQNDLGKLYASYQPVLDRVMKYVADVEAGAHVNTSEDRAVDHYNWRHPQELVPGKSLAHSLSLWEQVRSDVDRIRSGEIVNEDGLPFLDVIFNGIGGSYLGPLLLLLAQLGADYNVPTAAATRDGTASSRRGIVQRLHWVANTDPDSFNTVLSKVDLSRTIMVNISKSGTTAETKGNMDAFNKLLTATNDRHRIGVHNIAVTTPGSLLDKFAAANEFLFTYHMDEFTGGRTSIGSAVGMVPAAFGGLDFAAFLRGQSDMDALTRLADIEKNPAFLTALAIDHAEKVLQRKRNMIILGYSDALREFAHYLQQLYMESLGKEQDWDHSFRPNGLTVFGGVGTGEQHAFMQQVQKGIPDCFVRLVHFRQRGVDFPNEKAGTLGRQLLAFLKGTETALIQNNRDVITYTFEKNDEYNIGLMIALEERIVTILAAMYRLNAFDQPGVQDGKLACDGVNKLSKDVERNLAELVTRSPERLHQWAGAVDAFATTFLPSVGASVNVVDLDYILSDISANPQSYPLFHGQLRVSRTFHADRRVFVFTFYVLSDHQ